MEAKDYMLSIPLEESRSRTKAQELLAKCKEADAKKELVSVRIDAHTIKLMTPQKAAKYYESLNTQKK